MKYEPLNDNVLLRQIERRKELLRCEVIATGPGLRTLGGVLPCSVKKGDIVFIQNALLTWVFDDDDKYLLIHDHKIRLKE